MGQRVYIIGCILFFWLYASSALRVIPHIAALQLRGRHSPRAKFIKRKRKPPTRLAATATDTSSLGSARPWGEALLDDPVEAGASPVGAPGHLSKAFRRRAEAVLKKFSYTHTAGVSPTQQSLMRIATEDPEQIQGRLRRYSEAFNITLANTAVAFKRYPPILMDEVSLSDVSERWKMYGADSDMISYLARSDPETLLRRNMTKRFTEWNKLNVTQESLLTLASRCSSLLRIGRPAIKWKMLWRYGFDDIEIRKMLDTDPQVMTCNLQSGIEHKIWFLEDWTGHYLGDDKYRQEEDKLQSTSPEEKEKAKELYRLESHRLRALLVEYPTYFTYSLRRRIMPRFLVARDYSISLEPSLQRLLAPHDEALCETFSIPLQALYQAKEDALLLPVPRDTWWE